MRNILVALLVVAAMAGCTAHRIDVKQGNIISREKLAAVKPGMEPQQVRFILGAPLLQDPFHADRWDYYYTLQSNGEIERSYRVTLYFKDGRLERIEDEGNVPATERETIDAMVKKSKAN